MRNDPFANNLDLIERYYTGRLEEHELPERLRDQLERWEAAHRLYLQHGSKRKVIKMLQSSYGVGRATAFTDFDCACRLFGTLHRPDKDFERQYLDAKAKEILQLALAGSSPNLKEANSAISNLVKLHALDKPETGAAGGGPVEANKYVMQVLIDNRRTEIDLSRPEQVPQRVRQYLLKNGDDLNDDELEQALTS